MPSSHEDPAFTNAVTYTASVTYTVAGGARRGTADGRARKVAERLANSAARMPGVMEVSATAGWTVNGEVHWPQRVHFDQANSGHGTYGKSSKLDRYVDPEHERAVRSLAAANAAAEQRRQVDRDRRRNIACRNIYVISTTDYRYCGCVYCQPGDHDAAAEAQRVDPGNPMIEHRCLCGQSVPAAGDRCLSHRTAVIRVLEGDSAALRRLADTDDSRSIGNAGHVADEARNSARRQVQGLDL